MTILEYYDGMAACKSAAHAEERKAMPMTVNRLRYRYGSYVEVSRKKKGAKKAGYKITYAWRWSDYKGYMNELRELFPAEYGLMLCEDAYELLCEDEWWNTPYYRDQHLAAFKREISEYRRQYGIPRERLTKYFSVH